MYLLHTSHTTQELIGTYTFHNGSVQLTYSYMFYYYHCILRYRFQVITTYSIQKSISK